MSLTNRSNLRRTSDLLELLNFVEEYCKFSHLAEVEVITSSQVDGDGRNTYGGRTTAKCERGTTNRQYLVTIGLNSQTVYPRTQRLNYLTPKVRFDSWQDEVVTVLAHELRHVDQFVLGAFTRDQELEYEVDAEVFAAAVLDAYRAARKQVQKAA